MSELSIETGSGSTHEKKIEPPVGTGSLLLGGNANSLGGIARLGRGPWKRLENEGKLHTNCRKGCSQTMYIIRMYQGPTRLRQRKSLHWALSWFLIVFLRRSRVILFGRLSFFPFLTTALSVYRIELFCPPKHLQVLVASVSRGKY